MNEKKHNHTPGPWEAQGRNVLAKRPFGYVCWCDKQKGQHEANATLIAAAPDLLAALEALLANLDDADATKDENGNDFADILQCRAAIAKATKELS